MASQRITIMEIARAAGVTGATVSRALRSSPLVKPATRERIRSVADKMGYQPSMEARMLRLRSTPKNNAMTSWGFVVPAIKNGVFPSLLTSMVNQAQQREIQLLPCNSEFQGATTSEKVIQLIESGIQGLLIYPPDIGMIDAATLYKIQQSKIPIVSLINTLEGLDCPVVSIDYEQLGRMAAEHLLSLGRKRIGFITGRWWNVSKRQFVGFKEVLYKAGLDLPDNRVRVAYGPDWREKEVQGRTNELKAEYRDSVRRFLDEAQGLDGVDCGYDARAIQFIEVCRERGLRVPEDIAVIGSDNTRLGLECEVPLTTFEFHIELVACKAAQLLDRMISGEPLTREDSVFLRPELIVRTSTGGARG